MTLFHWVSVSGRLEQTQCLHKQGSTGPRRTDSCNVSWTADTYTVPFVSILHAPLPLIKVRCRHKSITAISDPLFKSYSRHCSHYFLTHSPTEISPINKPRTLMRLTVLLFLWRCGPTRAMGSSFLTFPNHTQIHHSRHDSSGQVISS